MILVSINGIIQIPGVDFTSTKNQISFSSPPSSGSRITIQGKTGTFCNIIGDGSTFLFHFMDDNDNEISWMLEDAFKFRNTPAVADMLERLRVVVELVKENDRSRV